MGLTFSVLPAFAVAVAMVLLKFVLPRRQPAIRNIQGPPSPSWIFGNMLQLTLPPQYGEYEFTWLRTYGSAYKVKGCFGQDRLMVLDPRALQFIVNSDNFPYSPTLVALVEWLYGPRSVTALRGTQHKNLTGVLSRGFTASAVRRYHSVFETVAQRITQHLNERDSCLTDMSPLLSDATLSAISEVVLGAPVETLSAEFVQNNTQILVLASSQSKSQILADAISASLPAWLLNIAVHLPTKTFNALRAQLYLATREGRRILSEKAQAAKHGLEPDADIFGSLLHSESSLTEEDIAAQTSLIMIAGQDTTANTLAFALTELARNPELQEALRSEIHSAVGSIGDMSRLYENMPLLDAVIKETLRMYPADPLAERIALNDALIPLSMPIQTKTGETITQIPVCKGQLLWVGIASYQRLQSRWGSDAEQFRPSRWLDGTIHSGEALGPYANLLSFFGGPTTCLGWRFAIFEMQVILCELVGKFSFSLPEHHEMRVKRASTLFPADSRGNKCAPLVVERHV